MPSFFFFSFFFWQLQDIRGVGDYRELNGDGGSRVAQQNLRT